MSRAADMPAPLAEDWPKICLIRPQMGENIGASARAMLNFGLTGLRLFEPRDRWPNPKAMAVAAGADTVLEGAQVDWRLDDCLADATLVIAATARPRWIEKPIWGAREAAEKCLASVRAGERPLVMFGAEASGLTSDEIGRADAIMTYPVNPGFASLNLANAVAVFCFAYGEARQEGAVPPWFRDPDNPPATHGELVELFDHLDRELIRGRFFHPPAKMALMQRNIRAPYLRARLTQQEVQTMRGIIKALTIGRGGRKLDES